MISLGTNSTRLLVVEGEPDVKAIVHETRGTRLGAGLRDGGRFDPQARARTVAAVEAYAAIARNHGAPIRVIATSAMRRADDARDLSERIGAMTDARVEILSGAEEARYSFLGATYGRAAGGGRVGVLDVGGGSSEYACGAIDDSSALVTRSIEIGAVRAGERFADLLGARALDADESRALENAVRASVRRALTSLAQTPRVACVYGVGGTVMTAAAIVHDRPREMATGLTIERGNLSSLARRLICQTRDERLATPRMNPQRADILPAGLLIVDEACAMLDVDRVESSAGDLLLGSLIAPGR